MEKTTGPTSDSGSIQSAQAAFSALLGGDPAETPEVAEAPSASEEEVETPEAEPTDQPEEGGEESEAEGESEGEDDSAEDQPTDTLFTVKVDGKELQVSLDELRSGYSRTQDYTRKTQALAEQRKTAEAELNAVRGERAQYSQLLTALQGQLQSLMPQEPDWNTLYQQDPIEFVRQREVWRSRQEQMQAIQAEQARVQQLAQQEQLANKQTRLTEEAQKLVSLIPEWKDEKVAKSEKAALVEYGTKLGYSADDLKAVDDHRIVNILRKAMKYDEMVARKGTVKPANSPTKTAKPGVRSQSPTSRSEVAQARQRLAKSGNVRDAAAVFSTMIK